MIMSDMLKTRPFHGANYISDPDDVFAYLEVLRAENAGKPGAWNGALEVLLACDNGRALPLGVLSKPFMKLASARESSLFKSTGWMPW